MFILCCGKVVNALLYSKGHFFLFHYLSFGSQDTLFPLYGCLSWVPWSLCGCTSLNVLLCQQSTLLIKGIFAWGLGQSSCFSLVGSPGTSPCKVIHHPYRSFQMQHQATVTSLLPFKQRGEGSCAPGHCNGTSSLSHSRGASNPWVHCRPEWSWVPRWTHLW